MGLTTKRPNPTIRCAKVRQADMSMTQRQDDRDVAAVSADRGYDANPLGGFRRVTIKIGSALLVDSAGLRTEWLDSVASDVAALRSSNVDVVIVSSGAIALGRSVATLDATALKLEEAQAAAAIGQIALARAWSEALGRYGLTAGQVLLAPADTERRRRYLNARATMNTLLKLNAVPVVNENDTVATSEIRYGDNDRLAARVAVMAGSDLLVLLSDVDGLYTANPQTDPSARHVPNVPRITAEVEDMAGGAASNLSRGGMRTKVQAAKIATTGGCAMVIADGRKEYPLRQLREGGRHTRFDAATSPANARKAWIAGHIDVEGTITIDGGAEAALRQGRSLLAAGVVAVGGSFTRGSTIALLDTDGHEIGRGLAAYNADDARAITGLRSSAIEAVLGHPPRSAVVHRDDLVLHEAAG